MLKPTFCFCSPHCLFAACAILKFKNSPSGQRRSTLRQFRVTPISWIIYIQPSETSACAYFPTIHADNW
ncbi:uncharacterized protein P174DRAFT_77448 [Aspergillus novofumigatus IBT 16806]|uniref:Uncharacterized protein n=1 Tax=Aspergillus novofumigatus (strain IBT 16806) TaxID=1392255 RepID=A0A2I1CFM9_ASPN1|nr:uncharacterized protein P174DRAFT_77448 [Aspergillus novofumigatus IBT 16806]PKX96398.1 hypothetical protein P174DRAFT_77448 [Aspergillus novofumigatus IBT 16806]